MTLWQWIVGFLVWLSADPAAIDLEAPKAAAAVAAARASLLVEAAPAPQPKSPTPAVCSNCKGSGWLTMPDGHRVKCPTCNGTGKGCPDGTCPKKP
jgi:hypothetical protein